MNLIQITPYRILLLDMSRKGNKYLLWQKARGGTEIEKEIQTVRQASTL